MERYINHLLSFNKNIYDSSTVLMYYFDTDKKHPTHINSLLRKKKNNQSIKLYSLEPFRIAKFYAIVSHKKLCL